MDFSIFSTKICEKYCSTTLEEGLVHSKLSAERFAELNSN